MAGWRSSTRAPSARLNHRLTVGSKEDIWIGKDRVEGRVEAAIAQVGPKGTVVNRTLSFSDSKRKWIDDPSGIDLKPTCCFPKIAAANLEIQSVGRFRTDPYPRLRGSRRSEITDEKEIPNPHIRRIDSNYPGSTGEIRIGRIDAPDECRPPVGSSNGYSLDIGDAIDLAFKSSLGDQSTSTRVGSFPSVKTEKKVPAVELSMANEARPLTYSVPG